MNGHLVRAAAVLAALFTLPITCAETQNTKCIANPDWHGQPVEVRSAPDKSAHLLITLNPKDNEIREQDIVSPGTGNNDWIKVTSGDVTGWVTAPSLECRLSPEEARTEIAAETDAVMQALADKDMDALAKYVHPIKGVRFSPSATIGPTTNVVLRDQEIRHWLQSTEKRTWGSDDATGEPIRLTPSTYYDRFIYNRNYRRAPVVGFNTIEAKSTDLNNLWEVYPNALVVEYYFPPSIPDGNDWASLRLVYEKHKGRWFLSGVIHDAWTI